MNSNISIFPAAVQFADLGGLVFVLEQLDIAGGSHVAFEKLNKVFKLFLDRI